MKRMISFLLCATILCSILAGCSFPGRNPKDTIDQDIKGTPIANGTGRPVDLMDGVILQESNIPSVPIGGGAAVSPMDFSVQLFKKTFSKTENSMVSPVSVLYALAMVANGAKGNTLAQIEKVLGMPISELNYYLKSYADTLPESEKNKLSIANSIWFTDDASLSVEQDFLQVNADFYGAGIYKAPFNDSTLKNINSWVEENTDGMIRDVLDEIPCDAIMYLINAIAFDAEWKEIYKDYQVRDGIFTTESGSEQKVELMNSTESLYLDDGNATGFMKYYADSQYAFVALLPKENLSVQEYISGMTGEDLTLLLSSPKQETVYAALPKFESEHSLEMSQLLADMGMEDAFDPNAADFTGLGSSTDGNIFISRVLHKSFIAVDEKGTQAGAATIIESRNSSVPIKEIKEVFLDRPFVYMIVDCNANLPLFIGALMEAG